MDSHRLVQWKTSLLKEEQFNTLKPQSNLSVIVSISMEDQVSELSTDGMSFTRLVQPRIHSTN